MGVHCMCGAVAEKPRSGAVTGERNDARHRKAKKKSRNCKGIRGVLAAAADLTGEAAVSVLLIQLIPEMGAAKAPPVA